MPGKSAYEKRQVRRQVFVREEGKCFWCERQIEFQNSTFDHIIPKSRGGSYSYENGVLSCKKCNFKRGDTDAAGYLCSLIYGS